MTGRSRLLVVIVLAIVAAFTPVTGCRQAHRVAVAFETDKAGRLTALSGPDRRKVSFEYNPVGLPAAVRTAEGKVQFQYDADGNRIQTKDSAGSTEYFYDAFGRVAAVLWFRGPYRLIAYKYDATGLVSRVTVFDLNKLQEGGHVPAQLASILTPGEINESGWHEREKSVLGFVANLLASVPGTASPMASDMTYVRTLGGDLKEIRTPGGTIRFIQSKNGRQLERRMPNGVTTNFEFTSRGTLALLRHTDGAGREVATYRYSYDGKNRLESISGRENGQEVSHRYSWDDYGQLKEARTASVDYLFDRDERTRQVVVTGAGHKVTLVLDDLKRIVRAKGAALSISSDGTLGVRQADGEQSEVRYNSLGNPVEIRTKSGSLRYVWDGEGNLVQAEGNGEKLDLVPAAGTGSRVPILFTRERDRSEASQIADRSVLETVAEGKVEFHLEDALGGSLQAGATGGIEPLITQTAWRRARRPGEMTKAMGTMKRGAQTVRLERVSEMEDSWNHVWQSLGWWNQPGGQTMWTAQSTAACWTGASLCRSYLQGAEQAMYYVHQIQEVTDQDAERNLKRGGVWLGVGAVEAVSATVFKPVGDIFNALPAVIEHYDTGSLRTVPGMNAVAPALIEDLAYSLVIDVGFKKALQWSEEVSRPFLTNRWANQNMDMLWRQESSDGVWKKLAAGDLVRWGMHADSAAGAMAVRSEQALRTVVGAYAEGGANLVDGLSHAYALSHGLENKPAASKPLGGVTLGSVVQGDLGRIRGAVCDPITGSVALLSDSGSASMTGLSVEDFAVALQMVYTGPSEEVSFSLDPADHLNPAKPWLKKVYTPDGLMAGTAFGKTLFDADWLLKQYSFGVVSVPGRQSLTARASNVAGYKSVAELTLADENHPKGSPGWARFWIVPRDMVVRRNGDSIVFDRASMGVNTKREKPDPSSPTGLKDDDSVRDPIDEEFAMRFTEHYDELAAESPELEHVRELAKAVAIARWLRERGVAVDVTGMHLDQMGLRAADADANSPVAALSTTYKKVKQKTIHELNGESVLTMTSELHLFGGVSLDVKPEVKADPSLEPVQQEIMEKMRHGNSPRFATSLQGKMLDVTVLPLTGEELARRASEGTQVRDGEVYHTDGSGRVSELTTRDGTIIRSLDAAMGAAGVEIHGSTGWRARTTPEKFGSRLDFTSRRGNEFGVESDASGEISSIAVDGIPWATVNKQGTGRTVRIDDGAFEEDYNFDAEGRVLQYQMKPKTGGEPGEETTVRVEYDSAGRLARMEGDGLPQVDLGYDGSGALQQVSSSNGASISLESDEDGEVLSLGERRDGPDANPAGPSEVKVTLRGNRPESLENLGFGATTFVFRDGRLTEADSEETNATTLRYGRNGDVAEVDLPSGNVIRRIRSTDGNETNGVEYLVPSEGRRRPEPPLRFQMRNFTQTEVRGQS